MIRELFLSNFSLSSCVWQSTIFILVGLISSFILRHRSARAHQVLFLAMIAAVIVPVISILVKHYELGLFVAEPVVIQSQTEDWAITSNYGASDIISAEDIEHKPGAIEKDLPSATLASETTRFPWRSVVLYGWIAASLILAARLLLTFALGVRLLKRALPLDCQRIKEAVHLAKAKLGIDKDVKVRSSRGVRSPVIWCWRRKPVLLVPSAAGRFDNGVDWAGVLCHELAHWKRRDHICGLLAEFVACILPWHPLVWWAKSRLVRLSEQACDDWVVATGQPGTDYAESLLDLIPGGQMAFVPAVVSSKKGLAGRVHRILKDSCGNPRTGALWALAMSIVAACLVIGVACAQTRPAKPETAAEREEKATKSLHQAVADGDIEQVKKFIAAGADVNARDNQSLTPLHFAAKGAHEEIARLRIAKGVDINSVTNEGGTPLVLAAYAGHKDIVELLISKGSDIEYRNIWGNSPLSEAAHRGKLDVAKFLLEKGTEVDSKNYYEDTPLHRAIMSGHKEMVEMLLANGATLRRGRHEFTPVVLAMLTDQKEMVRFLIGKNIEYSEAHVDAYFGDVEQVKDYLAKGGDINGQEPSGLTLLACAICRGQTEVAEFLLGRGANVNMMDGSGFTALQWASAKGRPEVTRLLVEKGADVRVRDNGGRIALHWAAMKGDVDIVETLIQRGSDVNARSGVVETRGRKDARWTPLHQACAGGHKNAAELLLTNGADINAKTNNGDSALSLAKRGYGIKGNIAYKQTVELLRKHGARE